ncbi:MAG: methylated-DNA--[Oscillospiraceae bacterium]|nr:methylated-DNA--[protein]-cysteine S-methyltransferase [Oscillospiraceae bacterium]
MSFEKMIESPIGPLTIVSDGESVTALRFGDQTRELSSCQVLEQAATELAEYFDGTRRSFSVPLNAQGTDFQRSVWAALREIPYGETASYAQIAAMIGKSAACRAVGNANHRNPLPIFIPCHRVTGKNGTLTGYAGGIPIKEFLLRLEQ